MAPQFGQQRGDDVEVSALVDVATVGVVRVAEVVDVVGVADTLGVAEVVVRGADVVETGVVDVVVVTGAVVLVVLENGVLDVVDVCVVEAFVVGVADVVGVVAGVSGFSCSRSLSRLSCASLSARSAFLRRFFARISATLSEAFCSSTPAALNSAAAWSTMCCPSASVEGFGGATYDGRVMRLVLVVGVGFGEGEGEGFGVVGVVDVVGTTVVVEVFCVVGVGTGWALGMVGIGSGGRSGKDGWLGDEEGEEDEEVEDVVGVGFGRSDVVDVVVVTSGGTGDGDGVGVGFWRRLLRRMRISASRGCGVSPGLRERPETMSRSSQLCASAIAWPISCAMVMIRLVAPTVDANICGLIRTVSDGPPPVTRPSTGRLGSTSTLTASGVLWSMNLISRYPPRSRTALTHRSAARWMSARWPVVSYR